MNLKQINNLTELFFDQFNKQIDKNKILLSTLGDKRKNYSWQETYDFINLVSNELRIVISKGDRCLLISENRPEWFIADLSIMLSDGITVPAGTVIPSDSIIDKSAINHSGLFSEINKHLSPFDITILNSFETKLIKS